MKFINPIVVSFQSTANKCHVALVYSSFLGPNHVLSSCSCTLTCNYVYTHAYPTVHKILLDNCPQLRIEVRPTVFTHDLHLQSQHSYDHYPSHAKDQCQRSLGSEVKSENRKMDRHGGDCISSSANTASKLTHQLPMMCCRNSPSAFTFT